MRVTGRAAFFGLPLPPTQLRQQAEDKLDRARQVRNKRDVEPLLRGAVEDLVDSFLFDRRGHTSAFSAAHAVGRRLTVEFGCPMKAVDDGWVSECGIHALHSRMALSPGGVTHGRCSVCGAGDFECEHVPGRSYSGQRCIRVVEQFHLEEVSFVRIPNDPRCYRVWPVRSASEVSSRTERGHGQSTVPSCEHCRTCHGRPTLEDLSPEAWPPIPDG